MIRYFTARITWTNLTGIIEGVPSGLQIKEADIAEHLARRQKGYEEVEGWRGKGCNVLIREFVLVKPWVDPLLWSLNRAFKDKAGWPVVMNKEVEAEGIEKITLLVLDMLTWLVTQKFRFNDIRPVIERSNARETSMRVACGSIARQF